MAIKKDIPGFEGTGDAFNSLVNQGQNLVKKYKSPLEQAEALTPKEKPLHVRSLENQVSWNPTYKKIVDSLGKLDDDVSDAYFYGLKDAHEKHNYEPTDDQIRDELLDQYYRLQDSYRDRWGYNDHDWDWYGEPRFTEKYGREDQFIKRLLDAYIKTMGR